MADQNDPGQWEGRPRDKSELMSRIHAEWAALDRLVRGLGPDQLTTPGPEVWSAKDHLAHLAAWQRILLVRHLQHRSFAEAAGIDATTAQSMKDMTAETGLNDYFYQRDKDLPLDAVLAANAAAHTDLLAALAALTDAELFAPHDPEQPDRQLIDWIVGDTYEHYSDHRTMIATIVRSGGAQG